MFYRVLADGILIVHLLFILFVLFGGLLALRRRLWIWVHLPAALWAVLLECFGWLCPLTPLENHLRAAAGQEGTSGGFIEHYLLPAIYPSGLTRSVQVGLALLVVAVNVAVYALVRRRYRSEDQA